MMADLNLLLKIAAKKLNAEVYGKLTKGYTHGSWLIKFNYNGRLARIEIKDFMGKGSVTFPNTARSEDLEKWKAMLPDGFKAKLAPN